MKEYRLEEERALVVMTLVEKRNQILEKFDAAMKDLERRYGEAVGISDGNFQQRGPDIYVVAQGEEESENL